MPKVQSKIIVMNVYLRSIIEHIFCHFFYNDSQKVWSFLKKERHAS